MIPAVWTPGYVLARVLFPPFVSVCVVLSAIGFTNPQAFTEYDERGNRVLYADHAEEADR